MTGRFAAAAKIADAVMYEGYMLYPYRKSALKNQHRWQFGVLAPRAEGSLAEASSARAECLIETKGEHDPAVTVNVRFLQLQQRRIEALVEGSWSAQDSIVVGGREYLAWDEAVPREAIADVRLAARPTDWTFPFETPGGRDVEDVRDPTGTLVARIVRQREPLSFVLRVSARHHGGLITLAISVENALVWTAGAAMSSDAEAQSAESLIGCHALLGVENGKFISQIDPPPAAALAARECNRQGWFPVLVGAEGSRDAMLCAPIILYDYPRVAPESGGDFFDATEIDELLTLRVLTLTDAEKRELAATDDRGRRILERVEGDGSTTRNLLGAVRTYETQQPIAGSTPSWESWVNPPGLPAPEDAEFFLGSRRVARGSRVRLTPRGSADAMDMFLVGRIATVAGVYQDLEERTHVAVTLDDDPSADLHRALGRYFYFSPDELSPVEERIDG